MTHEDARGSERRDADGERREKFEEYPNTVLELCGPPALRIDLRRPLTASEIAALAERGLAHPFAVLTAENPDGANVDDAPTPGEADRRADQNERRTDRLLDDLRARGVEFLAADGVSPDGSYREHCVAVRLSRAEALDVARRFGQLALFWFDGARFWLLPARLDEEPKPLPG